MIQIGGRKLSSIPLEELHQKFGVVFQNDVLFADTIYENIDFGRHLPPQEIEKAARCAQAWDFISSLPATAEPPAHLKGTNLSGGQKQRVLVARALAGSPEILILDDSSSALDYKTDAALRESPPGRISGHHPPSSSPSGSAPSFTRTTSWCWRRARSWANGTHQELLRSCQVYQEIAHSQMGVQVASGDRPGPTEPAGETQAPAPGQASEPTPFQPLACQFSRSRKGGGLNAQRT